MRNPMFILLLVIVAAAGIVWYVRHRLYQTSMSITGLRINKPVSMSSVTGSFNLMVDNPLGISFTVEELLLSISIDGNKVGSVQSIAAFDYSGEAVSIPVSFSTNPQSFLKNVRANIRNIGNNQFTIEGEATVSKWIFSFKIPISFTDNLKNYL